jgi:hypothetical protein
LLLEQADALGEPAEDPLLLFSVLYGVFVAKLAAFNGDACRDIAAHTLELAEKQSASSFISVFRVSAVSTHETELAD